MLERWLVATTKSSLAQQVHVEMIGAGKGVCTLVLMIKRVFPSVLVGLFVEIQCVLASLEHGTTLSIFLHHHLEGVFSLRKKALSSASKSEIASEISSVLNHGEGHFVSKSHRPFTFSLSLYLFFLVLFSFSLLTVFNLVLFSSSRLQIWRREKMSHQVA